VAANGLTLTPIDSAAGYFRADLRCPRRTGIVRFQWTNAPSRAGRGEATLNRNQLSVSLRMQAATPGGLITVKIRCLSYGRGKLADVGPVTIASGNALTGVPPNSGAGRRIVYSLSAQQVWLIEANEVVYNTHLVSGRRLGITSGDKQHGKFKVFSKSVRGCSGSIVCPNMVRFNPTPWGNIGFHAIPLNRGRRMQTDAELGQPRSHGCVRQANDQALIMYAWAQKGDVVYVID
jgi:hypothetical protein